MGQFCRAQHQAWKESPTEANHQGVLFLLTCFSFGTEMLCCFGSVMKNQRPCAIVLCHFVHTCTQWQIYCILPVCTFSSAALLKLLEVVIPCFVENVRKEHERQVVMGILETMNSVIKSCKEAVFTNPAHLKEVSHVIRDVLKKKVSRLTLDWDPDFLEKKCRCCDTD